MRPAAHPARVAHRVELVRLLNAVFAADTARAWVERLLAAGIPAGPINTVTDILADPNTKARGLIHVLDGIPMIGHPVGFSATPTEIRRPPPAHGQHTGDILREFGLEGSTPES